jgi:hypothetical protein
VSREETEGAIWIWKWRSREALSTATVSFCRAEAAVARLSTWVGDEAGVGCWSWCWDRGVVVGVVVWDGLEVVVRGGFRVRIGVRVGGEG